MIIALAGRRIDAQNSAIPRFPLEKCSSVYKRILSLLYEQQATTLVSSAACGADLLALKAAKQLGIRRHVILPFSSTYFRMVSVADRPGEWESLFDQVISEVRVAGDLVLLDEKEKDTEAFIRANRAILNEAQALACQTHPGDATSQPQHILAVIVWDGQSRGEDDLTVDFIHEAHARNIPVLEIRTQ